MSLGLWGALLGALAAAGVLLVAARVMVIRKPQLAVRVLPYIRDLPQAGRTPALRPVPGGSTSAAVGVFGGEPCLVLAEEEDDEGGLHIAYAGHDGRRAEELGYWLVDHGAYEVVVPPEEVHAIRVEQVPVPLGGDQEPSDR